MCFHLGIARTRASGLKLQMFQSDSGVDANNNITLVAFMPLTVTSSSHMIFKFVEAYTVPIHLTVQDMDLRMNGIEWPLAAVPGTVTSGVTWTGTQMRLTLGSTAEIGAGSTIEIAIGNHAQFGGNGSHQIRNPAVSGIYGISLTLTNQADAVLASDATNVSILPHTAMSLTIFPKPQGPTGQQNQVDGGAGGLPNSIAYVPKPSDTSNQVPQDRSMYDLNFDHTIDATDYYILVSIWRNGTYDARADLNGDRLVTLQDLSILLTYWHDGTL